jgi:hypothetical protein
MKICHLQTPGHHKIDIQGVQMVNFIDINESEPNHLLALKGKISWSHEHTKHLQALSLLLQVPVMKSTHLSWELVDQFWLH